ncbi:MAG TPA: hypothetical protein VG674_12470 [Amycolatopsis sp.]|nr:hypothetical protein [Amycolatopsis sp.]
MRSHRSRPVIGLTHSSTDFERFSLWRNVLHGFAEAGAVLLTIDCRQPHADIERVIRRLDGLVLSGGALYRAGERQVDSRSEIPRSDNTPTGEEVNARAPFSVLPGPPAERRQ